jgi:hypothetical protein
VRVLPPGRRLLCERNHWEIEKTRALFNSASPERLDGAQSAAGAVYEYLEKKCRSYDAMSEKPIAGFLSGGWDSRLLVAMFHKAGNMERTYTSQQLIRFGNRIISEKKIAMEVARFLGVPNEFVAPVYRNPENRNQRIRMVDCATWFHDWAYGLAEALPRDAYLFCDGLLGDILLRGLYLPPELLGYQREEKRDRVVEWFHARYLEGFNPYTKGVEQWGSVIRPSVLERFSDRLREEISNEIHFIADEDFVTCFLLRNRSRRGISPLPRWILGSKGTVIFPFCDEGFLRLILSIPLAVRLDDSLYRMLLEKTRPGLSDIPSTNTVDPEVLGPYLLESTTQLAWQGRMSAELDRVPVIGNWNGKICRGATGADRSRWVEELLERPPRLFQDLLKPDIQAAIDRGSVENLAPYRFFLERILLLGDYFS